MMTAQDEILLQQIQQWEMETKNDPRYIIPQIKEKLAKVVNPDDIYNDPRQIVYVEYTDYMQIFKVERDKCIKEGEIWEKSELTPTEKKIIEIAGDVPVYRWVNLRGRALVFRCQINENAFHWDHMTRIN